jgi:hypothetical protein
MKISKIRDSSEVVLTNRPAPWSSTVLIEKLTVAQLVHNSPNITELDIL